MYADLIAQKDKLENDLVLTTDDIPTRVLIHCELLIVNSKLANFDIKKPAPKKKSRFRK